MLGLSIHHKGKIGGQSTELSLRISSKFTFGLYVSSVRGLCYILFCSISTCRKKFLIKSNRNKKEKCMQKLGQSPGSCKIFSRYSAQCTVMFETHELWLVWCMLAGRLLQTPTKDPTKVRKNRGDALGFRTISFGPKDKPRRTVW